jgi:hypothetical protein
VLTDRSDNVALHAFFLHRRAGLYIWTRFSQCVYFNLIVALTTSRRHTVVISAKAEFSSPFQINTRSTKSLNQQVCFVLEAVEPVFQVQFSLSAANTSAALVKPASK